MSRKLVALLGAVTMVALGQGSGCTNLLPTTAVDFNLGGADGLALTVAGGQPTTQPLSISYDPAGVTVGRGSMRIKPDSVSFTPAPGSSNKGLVNFQTGETTVVVTARVDGPTAIDTVCDSTDAYGPYTVTFDENFVPVSVEPASITLSENALTLLNAGDFSLCLEVTSSADGTLSLFALTLDLGL